LTLGREGQEGGAYFTMLPLLGVLVGGWAHTPP
jgi:hypothetical protein